MQRNFYIKLSILLIVYLVASTVFFSYDKKAEELVNVMDFGAKGNGETDDTKAIQDAIDFQSNAGGGTVLVPKGIYLINTYKSVMLKNNITLKFEDNSLLKAIATDKEYYEIINITDVENVKILGAVEIQGDRDHHLGKTGEWGFGISIRGSTNIVVENPHITNCWGDGIYIGSTLKQQFSENIKILNPTLINNRRQGISIISAKNLEIINANISKTNGTLPESGIDIEPNNIKEILQGIRIINLNTKENAQYGFKIYLKKIKFSENPVSIYVDSSANIADGISVKEIEGIKGIISIGGYYHISDEEIVTKPLVEPLTVNSTKLVGVAPVNATVAVKLGTLNLGTSKTNDTGKFVVMLPSLKVGTALSVTAIDIAGNVSKETIVTVEADKFLDVKFDSWFYDEVLYLSGKNIVQGFPNGIFLPHNNTTRAEAAKMLTIALNLSTSNKKTEYSDLKEGHWAQKDIAAVTEAGLFSGYSDKTFKPDNNITRAEMAKVLAFAFNLKASNEQVFYDVPVSHWASTPIAGLYKSRLTIGYPDKTFKPSMPVTRAEFSVFLARGMNEEFR